MERVHRRSGFINSIEVNPEETRGGLCLAWRADFNITLQSFSKRHIDVIVEDKEKGTNWRFTGFYGSKYAQDRNDAWDILKSLACEVATP